MDDAHDKPFEATPSRLERARREGDLPRSADAAALAAFAGASLALVAIGAPCAEAARAALADATRGTLVGGPYAVMATCAVMPAIGAIAVAVAANLMVGGQLAVRPLALDLARLNPLGGLRTMLSRDAALNAAKALLAGLALGTASWPALAATFAGAARGGGSDALTLIAGQALVRIVLAALAVATLFAAIDVVSGRSKWRRKQRMNYDDLKRDLKQDEGDPLVRGRRRKTHGALVRGSLERIRDAAFVVANPTHVAVALAYRPPEIAVPLVLIRAVDDGALLVKERARALEIPIVEDIALARTLFARTQVDAFIPRETYDAVARIVAALLHQRKGLS